MSAFFVAVATIDAAVSAFLAEEDPLSLDAATQLGRELWRQGHVGPGKRVVDETFDPMSADNCTETYPIHASRAIGQPCVVRCCGRPRRAGHRQMQLWTDLDQAARLGCSGPAARGW